MKKTTLALSAALIGLSAAMLPTGASAQNIAVVNGKGVPKARLESLMTQYTRQSGQPRTPELEARMREELVMREIFAQEAERRGVQASADFRAQLDFARQSLLIRELFTDWQKKNPVTDAEVQAEYDKFKGQAGEKEYRARHILVEGEDEAKALIAQIKGGAKFEDLAKKASKDPGSAANGGDLDWAAPGSYVPEFSQAMVALQKGQVTAAPVKSQFGWHVIQLDDVRDAQFPPLEEVKAQLQQRLAEQKMAKYREDLRTKAKTDFKFTN
jgi:peptidyl-prolyl cis-trans isomerase C